MTRFVRSIISLLAGLVVVGLLVSLSVSHPFNAELGVAVFLFAWLIVFTITYSIPFANGAISLMPMTVAAAYLALGKVPAAWATAFGVLMHAGVRRWRADHDSNVKEPWGWGLVEVTAVNITMHTSGILVAGVVYEALGGLMPLIYLTPEVWLELVAVFLAYLGVNYALAAVYLRLRSVDHVRAYAKALPKLAFLEGGPMIFAPLVAIVYTRLGPGYFDLLALLCVVSTLIANSLANTSESLGRRVQELASLQAVGRALSTSLDLETVVSAIYEQVSQLMATPSFYVALYDADMDEVSFPLVIRDHKRVEAEPRRARHGLTEYVIETRRSLFIPRNVSRHIQALGIEHIGREAACWLGVPIMAGREVLGMIAVQSHDTPKTYGESHQQVLEVIAAQAAIAIQNARLYERTDEALARRVQELNSVLRTTQEGVLLLDTEWHLLALNRALAEFIDVVRSELGRAPIDSLRTEGEPVIALIGYTPEDLATECRLLEAGEVDQMQETVVLEPSGIQVERTLTPVRGAEGTITGWLLLFRDLTEELELSRLRQDMTNMLVHDLRSPLSMIISGIELLPEAYELRDPDRFRQILDMARHSSERILMLIDQLLDVSQLERGQLPLTLEPVEVGALLRETRARFSQLAVSDRIALRVAVDSSLPPVRADRSLMLRVLANLVDNALKFTPDGGRVQLWARRDGDLDPDKLLIGVRDTGPGIPAEYLDRVFEKFQQIPSTHGRRRGTGLGLFFCKLVVEAHDGEIWVDSEVGKGTVFLMAIPIVDRSSRDYGRDYES